MRDLAKSANGALLVLLETAYEEPRPPCGAIDLAPLLEHLRHALASPDMHVRVAVSAARLPCSSITFYFISCQILLTIGCSQFVAPSPATFFLFIYFSASR